MHTTSVKAVQVLTNYVWTQDPKAPRDNSRFLPFINLTIPKDSPYSSAFITLLVLASEQINIMNGSYPISQVSVREEAIKAMRTLSTSNKQLVQTWLDRIGDPPIISINTMAGGERKGKFSAGIEQSLDVYLEQRARGILNAEALDSGSNLKNRAQADRSADTAKASSSVPPASSRDSPFFSSP